jgi:hypothetical protein
MLRFTSSGSSDAKDLRGCSDRRCGSPSIAAFWRVLDEDFGPLFIKFSSYFPYTGRVCLNGHEWLKRQLAKEGIAFSQLDNGLLSAEDPTRAQELADSFGEPQIEAVFRKWLARLPHPFAAAHRSSGYRYKLSILQAEIALTQVFDSPLSGRRFFDTIVREHLDLGRPSRVQLIFGRRITRRTPSRFRTRVVTNGVVPTLHVTYKNCGIKQYHKEGRALRTETTINDTRDFGIGRWLCNLPALREIGTCANRRLLSVQILSHDPIRGGDELRSLHRAVESDSQRSGPLRFGDERVMAVMAALLLCVNLPEGFRNRDLRHHVALLLGLDPADFTQGRMTYDLRRLRLHGLIHRVPRSFRYHLTERGIRVAAIYHRLAVRILAPALDVRAEPPPDEISRTRAARALMNIQRGIDQLLDHAAPAA